MSLRLRLIVLVAGLVVSLLGGLGLYLRGALGAWSFEVLDDELRHHLDAIAARVEVEHGGEIELEGGEPAGDVAFRITGEGGEVLLERGLGAFAAGVAGPATVRAPDGREWRVVSRAIDPEHGPLVVAVGEPAGRFDEVTRRFRVGLAIALFLGAVLGTAGAALLAELITRPLRRVSRDVASVEASSLDRRLSTRGLDPDLARLASALNGALDRLEDAFAQQRAFVARASHALRTPLASMLAVAEVSSRRERPAEEHRAALREIAALASSASAMVAELLSLERADVAAGSLERGPVRLAEVAEDMRRLFAARAAEAGLTLELEVPDALAVDADRARLSELLEALLDNALRYTPRGGRVTLGARETDGAIELEVADTGPGIAPAELPRVFERFYRGAAASASGQPGSGLGLAIAKAIADAHGVPIALAPRDGGGTAVRTRWPRAPSGRA